MAPVTPTPQYRARLHILASDLCRERPDLRSRVERAVALVEAGAVIEQPGQPVQVRSASGRGTYTVSVNMGCCCPDAVEGRAPLLGAVPGCKHFIAYLLLCRASVDRAPVAPPAGARVIRFPRPEPMDVDAPIPFALTKKALAALDGEWPPAA